MCSSVCQCCPISTHRKAFVRLLVSFHRWQALSTDGDGVILQQLGILAENGAEEVVMHGCIKCLEICSSEGLKVKYEDNKEGGQAVARYPLLIPTSTTGWRRR